ncbi:MAG: hypothetical protein NZ561_12460, partial [Phycisphaerae bacterium]|nr:hypothetical protein [Phycisphaerae bacterium]
MRWTCVSMVILATSVLMAGCDDPADAPGARRGTDAASTLPAGLLLTAAPPEPRNIADLRDTARPGARVVLRGVVAGRAEPIASNRAMLTLLDAAIRTCDSVPGDSCPTPWDACCEPSDVLARHSATIQVVDESGQPLRVSLSSMPGI